MQQAVPYACGDKNRVAFLDVFFYLSWVPLSTEQQMRVTRGYNEQLVRCRVEVGCAVHGVSPLRQAYADSLEMRLNLRGRQVLRGKHPTIDQEWLVMDGGIWYEVVIMNLVSYYLQRGQLGEGKLCVWHGGKYVPVLVFPRLLRSKGTTSALISEAVGLRHC